MDFAVLPKTTCQGLFTMHPSKLLKKTSKECFQAGLYYEGGKYSNLSVLIENYFAHTFRTNEIIIYFRMAIAVNESILTLHFTCDSYGIVRI